MNGKQSLILLFTCFLLSAFLSCSNNIDWANKTEVTLHNVIMKNAEWGMSEQPQTVTDFHCERSAGGIHDFYSEGDYWWPNPSDPEGPYIRKDGQTNPDNFVAHRLAMIRFNKIVGALASAYLVTGDEKYVKHAFVHINAWLTNPATMMNPNLLYAQAIKGITTGRGIGIIDTIHLMEVAQGIARMQDAACVDKENLKAVKKWFSEYASWITTHQNGIDEMNAQNNHGSCWVMQLAAFSKLIGDKDKLDFCKTRYKNVLLPDQMAENGSFPKEISRTKPYGYSLFNLDVIATICQILSTPDDNLWEYTTSKGLNMRKGIDFMYPFIKDKSTWTSPQDVMYWDNWPVAQPALLFAAKAYADERYFDLWKSLDHTPTMEEVERNLPVRNPLIWVN